MAIGVTWFLALCSIVAAGAETVEHVIPLDNPDYITFWKSVCALHLPYVEDNKLILYMDKTDCGKYATVHLPPELVCDRSQSIVISYVLELFPSNEFFQMPVSLLDTDGQGMHHFTARYHQWSGNRYCGGGMSLMYGGPAEIFKQACDFQFGASILRQPFRVDMLLNRTHKGLAVNGSVPQYTHDSEGEACSASARFGWGGLGWWTGHTVKVSDVKITVSGSKPSTTSKSASTTSTSITTSSGSSSTTTTTTKTTTATSASTTTTTATIATSTSKLTTRTTTSLSEFASCQFNGTMFCPVEEGRYQVRYSGTKCTLLAHGGMLAIDMATCPPNRTHFDGHYQDLLILDPVHAPGLGDPSRQSFHCSCNSDRTANVSQSVSINTPPPAATAPLGENPLRIKMSRCSNGECSEVTNATPAGADVFHFIVESLDPTDRIAVAEVNACPSNDASPSSCLPLMMDSCGTNPFIDISQTPQQGGAVQMSMTSISLNGQTSFHLNVVGERCNNAVEQCGVCLADRRLQQSNARANARPTVTQELEAGGDEVVRLVLFPQGARDMVRPTSGDTVRVTVATGSADADGSAIAKTTAESIMKALVMNGHPDAKVSLLSLAFIAPPGARENETEFAVQFEAFEGENAVEMQNLTVAVQEQLTHKVKALVVANFGQAQCVCNGFVLLGIVGAYLLLFLPLASD